MPHCMCLTCGSIQCVTSPLQPRTFVARHHLDVHDYANICVYVCIYVYMQAYSTWKVCAGVDVNRAGKTNRLIN